MTASSEAPSRETPGRGSTGARFAVIGAGLAGLTAARVLGDRGHQVVVLEKARGPGGRMSTRRDGSLRFDHGAQYFTARHPRFIAQVEAWREAGLVQRWDADIAVIDSDMIRPAGTGTERYVGVPGMNAVCGHLARARADCRFGWQVTRARAVSDAWVLESSDGDRLEADYLLLTAPPEQCRSLIDDPSVHEALAPAEMRPCWAVMAVFDRPLLQGWDAAFVNTGALSWIASQASKPGRSSAHAWTLHASPDWSRAHLEDDRESVAEALLAEATKLKGAAAVLAKSVSAHRWRYALADEPLETGAFWFEDRRLAIAGDWCAGSRIEGAFLSGLEAGERIASGLAG
ncbi:MAG: FAD-dependent oxidoreductase [Gammaproteobacteria bacterium]|jgi:predicted NAD/FAD-dependent oxidoreductase